MLILLGVLVTVTACSRENRVLVITGGHDFDEPAFYAMLDDLPGIQYQSVAHPEAFPKLENEMDKWDAVLFYDMPQSMAESDKQVVEKMVEAGVGLVFMHHALCAYDDWPEYTRIRGGRYVMQPDTLGDLVIPASNYQHDVDFDVQVVAPDHPVTRGVQDFTIHDEVYGNCRVLASVTPLLKTDHPQSMETVAWAHEYENSSVVYLLFGHGPTAYADENVRRLLGNALQFVSH